MKFIRIFAAASALALLAGTAAQASVVTAISGAVSAQSDARIGSGSTLSDPHTDSVAGLPGFLYANSISVVYSPASGNLDVSGSPFAVWNSADSGYFRGQEFGWTWFLAPGDGGGAANLNNGAANWAYAFTANSNAVFHMAYDVVASGDVFGLQGWSLYVNGVNALNLFNPYDPTAKGAFDYNLVSGQSYLMELRNNANISAASDLTAYSGHMNGEFKWNITASGGVPEPATWALMIGGFGLAGASLRRRRALAA